jgi:peptide/nickel transport system permease protein
MIGETLHSAWRDFWREYRKEASGVVGMVLFLLFVAAVALEPRLITFPETNRRWHDITYWDDNPTSAPPEWTNVFARQKSAVSAVLDRPATTVEKSEGGVRLVRNSFAYDYQYDVPPLDLIVHFTATGDMPLAITLTRPDGEEITLYQDQISVGEGIDQRISIDKNATQAAFDYLLGYEPEEVMTSVDAGQLKPTLVFFSKAREGMMKNPEPQKGLYTVTLLAMLTSEEVKAENAVLVVSGRVSGLLGTDNSKRDLWSGVIAGVKWALLIGLLTAFVSVAIGVIWGIAAAYFGGWTNWLMQRIFEVFVNQPLLPLMIVLSAVFKPSIWFLIVIMSLFFWTGPVKTVYSMALQIKEETFIEASRALGAGSGRLIFRHMVPILVPYSFASMALSVPGAVVYESTISLLGLGDASIVTWGQILHDSFTGGAVLNGLWWWVVPPGLMIALMGMTFSFIGFAMDKILHPKLRTR